MKKKKSFRTKRGFTLVELVVTVGVLSIVAGMGVGIVASAIRNYSTASTTSSAQDTSLLIERFIVEAIRGSSKLDFASNDKTGKIEFSKSETEKYIYFENGDLVTATSFVEKSGATPIVSKLYYSGVKSITFMPKRSNHSKNDFNINNSKNFIQIYYEIEMDEGYTLSGSTVMMNADLEEWNNVIVASNEFTNEASTSYEIKSETSDGNKKQIGVKFFS